MARKAQKTRKRQKSQKKSLKKTKTLNKKGTKERKRGGTYGISDLSDNATAYVPGMPPMSMLEFREYTKTLDMQRP